MCRMCRFLTYINVCHSGLLHLSTHHQGIKSSMHKLFSLMLFPPLAYAQRPQCVVFPSLCPCVLIIQLPLISACSVWFSVPVSVCWGWWLLGSAVFLQRTWFCSFYGFIVFRGIYVPHFLCTVYCRWALGLVPGLCYCKQYRCEHTYACVFIIEWFVILWVYTQ